MRPMIEDVFESLLAQVQSGRRMEDCLKEYPRYRDELEPLLIVCCQMKGLPKIPEPDPQSFESTVSRVRRTIYEQREQPRPSFLKSLLTGHPVLVRTAAAILLVLLVGWGGISFSSQSLPGNLLYPVKRLTELARYRLTFTPDGKAELCVVFAQNRTDELLRTFRPHATLDKDLLNAMLNGTRDAQKRAEELSGTRAQSLAAMIQNVNQRQRSTLENIRPDAAAEDSSVIDQAISLCARRGDCLANGCCTECQCDSSPCLCPWEFECDWK